ncbi:MAG: hypothetical protein HQK66_15245, partial [Desulfamplus sp.]|nr:hypothetical protein [Desulfamplus sp.]
MTLNIAHRGARSIAPENTLAAADIARTIGADLWETDVNVTRDGSLILFHDDHLKRTTNVRDIFPHDPGTYFLKDYDLDSIKMLDAVQSQSYSNGLGDYRGERIPTLQEALEYTKSVNWPVNLELKMQGPGLKCDFPLPQETASMIIKMEMDPDLVIISSFNHQWLMDISLMLPGFKIQALVEESPLGHHNTVKDMFKNTCKNEMDYYGKNSVINSFNIFNINNDNITIGEITHLKSMEKKVNIFTVNEEDRMVELINAGVDGIIT